MVSQTPMGLMEQARRIEGDQEVQCKLRDLIKRIVESRPSTTLEDLTDYDLLRAEDLCEEHIIRLFMRYEKAANISDMRMVEITVEMVAEIMHDILPLAA